MGWTCEHWSAAIAARVRHRTILRCCWGCWFTVTRAECLRAGSWSAPPTIRWRFASLRPMAIRTTTRSRLLSSSKGRRRFLKEFTELFVKVFMLAREMGVLQLDTVAQDGTKIDANASR